MNNDMQNVYRKEKQYLQSKVECLFIYIKKFSAISLHIRFNLKNKTTHDENMYISLVEWFPVFYLFIPHMKQAI